MNHKPNQISFWHPASLIATCFGVGKIPFAPGTFGSLIGVFIALNSLSPIVILALFFIGRLSVKSYLTASNSNDPKEVVIDEVVGMLITSCSCMYLILYLYGDVRELAEGLITLYPDVSGSLIIVIFIQFLTFRFFDIVKPSLVGWADRNVKGAWGVMLDDIIAGIFAGITSALVFLVV